LTANHVVKSESDLKVGLSSSQLLPAQVLGRDPTTDVAVLKIDARLDELPSWINDEDLRVGHIVLALGRPGIGVQATLGVVSALGDNWRTPAGGELTRFLQTDVVMYPGFSGGPLVSANGGFAGMNTSALIRGVSIAVPGSSLKLIAEELIEYGQVRRGYLGVSLQIVRLADASSMELGQKTGLLITGIEAGSPASESGLFQGDVLVSANEVQLSNMDDLFVQLSRDSIGSHLKLIVIRAGVLHNVEVKVGTRETR
jgi:S1-C subfamily serine protease